ncbi:MAG TPA: maleylpyruvate isomerase N-terminal domain-containing protein [Thermomonospora sp.]|nr:maleylpyruvate isomerase N-terminal domain-containing protein [Thermomonospora sp.]
MTATISLDQWAAVRRSAERSAGRFAALLADAPDPRARATAHWSVADTAAHVATIARLYTGLLGDGRPLPYPGMDERLRTATVDTVADLNTAMLRRFPERDPLAVARLLQADVAEVLMLSEAADPDAPVPWLGDARVPVAGVLAHLLNEIHLHGRDIARAARLPWEIPPADIGLFFELFVIGMTRHGLGHLLDCTEPPPERRIAVELRSRYTTPVTMVLQDRRVFVEEPRPGADVRLSFHPPTLSLMLFGRVGRLRAVASGRVVVGGRRPWLLPAFLRTVRFPS